MTIFGGDTYGSATAIYGAEGVLTFDALPFVATCIDANIVKLTWVMPTGTWTRLRLVRSSWGASVDENDGGSLFDLSIGPSSPSPSTLTSFFDVGVSGTTEGGDLPGDRWYDYSLWCFGIGVGESGADDWVFAGRTDCLVTNDHKNSERMQNLLPSVFTTAPQWAGGGQADTDTQMSRFLSLFGFQADVVRASYESLLHLHDPDRTPSRVLALLCSELGVPYEPQLGLSHTRVLLRNAMHIHKTKGTGPGVEDFASSLTGWGCDVRLGHNLMLDFNDSSAEQGVGGWYAKANCTLAQVGPDTLAPFTNDTNLTNGAMALTSINSGFCGARLGDQAGARGVLASGIPVQSSQEYTISAYVQPATVAVTNAIGMQWFDNKGKLISASFDVPTLSVLGTWTRISASSISPINAAFASLFWSVQATGSNEVHYADAIQLEVAASPSAFQEARQLQLYLSADRANYVPNPSFEVDTTLWTSAASPTAAAATSITRVSPDNAPEAGTCAAAVLTPGTAVNEGVTTTVAGLTGNQDYMVTAWVKPVSGRPVVLRVQDTTNGGAIVESALGTGTDWVRLNAHIVTGNITSTVSISLTTDDVTAAASVFRIDAVMLERGVSIRDYFDASTVGVSPSDYLWAGTAHASVSYLYVNRVAKILRLTELLPDYIWPGTTFNLITGQPSPGTSHLAYGGGAYGIDQFG